jgi:hypothetical protein
MYYAEKALKCVKMTHSCQKTVKTGCFLSIFCRILSILCGILSNIGEKMTVNGQKTTVNGQKSTMIW